MSASKPPEDGPQLGAGRLSESLRELTDAQRQSVAVAAGLFDQLIDEARQRETPRLNIEELLSPLAADGDRSAALAQIRSSVTRTIDLYSDLVNETFAIYADAIEQVLGRDGGPRPASSSGGASPVALSGRPGAEATAKVWLHNATSAPVTGVRLWMTGLTAHDGRTLHETACAFFPGVLDVEAGSSASAAVSVTVPTNAGAGDYHGLVLATGLPAAGVPVLLTVQ